MSTEHLSLRVTGDGSITIFSDQFQASYHSIHGAVTESKHVFIDAGLSYIGPSQNTLQILEMGFGSGLNALLSYLYADAHQVKVAYTGLELFPIPLSLVQDLGYPAYLNAPNMSGIFHQMHTSQAVELHMSEYFSFRKIHSNFLDWQADKLFDLVYYDAFAPSAQTELWEQTVFEKLASIAAPGAILVTYCAKGYVRRGLQAAGFEMERIPGPPGKREMLRGRYPVQLEH